MCVCVCFQYPSSVAGESQKEVPDPFEAIGTTPGQHVGKTRHAGAHYEAEDHSLRGRNVGSNTTSQFGP